MCGIVATLGAKQAAPFILKGLQALEYRGYDSAGLVVVNRGGAECLRAVGHVSNLMEKAKTQKPAGQLGIGHTRWATHGRVLVKNTHPHCDDKRRFFVVHNGIIENFQTLKQFLIEQGHRFRSDTDSEVIAQMMAYNFKQTRDVRQAFLLTLRSLKGAYALAMVCKGEPDKLWGAKLSGPLVLGIGNNQFYLASDPAALAEASQKIVILEDNEVVEIGPDGYTIMHSDDETIVERAAETIDFSRQETQLVGYPDFMSQEIHEVPRVIEAVTRGRLNTDLGIIKLGGLELVAEQLRHVDRLLVIACGTSYFAGLIGEYLFEEISHIPVEVQLASEFRYRTEPLSRSTAVVVISQSGETADTIAALQKIDQSGLLKLGIVNVAGSTLSRLTDAGVYCQAGTERSVAATKSFIAQVVVLTMMALYFDRYSGQYQTVLSGLAALPQKIERLLAKNKIAGLAQKYAKSDNFLFLGRRYAYPVALEGALKLKEISYIHAEGMAAGEIKHGSLALIDKKCPTLAVALSNDIYDKMASNLAEIKARGGRIVAIVDNPRGEAARLADDLIVVPKVVEPLQPIVAGVACHLFAYHIAKSLGRPIDKPRNLAKSVTVE